MACGDGELAAAMSGSVGHRRPAGCRLVGTCAWARPQLQEDAYYAEYLEREAAVFGNFRPQNLPGEEADFPSADAKGLLKSDMKFAAAGLEGVRVGRYEKYRRVFLVHSWRPSRQPGQVADIVLQLQQHGDGPLKSGLVEAVEYALGPNFFTRPHVKTNCEESFRLEVSANGPMLCVARVWLKDGSSFDLERYVDFAPAVGGGATIQSELLRGSPIAAGPGGAPTEERAERARFIKEYLRRAADEKKKKPDD